MEMFNGVWPTWTKVPKDQRDLMWQRFQGLYEWDLRYNDIARQNWENIMGSRHGDLMRETRDGAKDDYEAKSGLTFGTDFSVLKPFCLDWIDQVNWTKLIDECWNIQSWKKISVVNTRNRGSSANEKKATHCGGSCSLVHTKLKMEKEKGGPVSFLSVFDSYYRKKRSTPEQPQEFASQKAEDVRTEYERLAVEECGSVEAIFAGTRCYYVGEGTRRDEKGKTIRGNQRYFTHIFITQVECEFVYQ